MFEYRGWVIEDDRSLGRLAIRDVEMSALLDDATFQAQVEELTEQIRRGWTELTPGPELAAAALRRLAAPGVEPEVLLDCIDALERSTAALAGEKAAAIARFMDVEPRRYPTGIPDGMKSAEAQLEMLLKLSPTATTNLVGRSMQLEQLPRTLAALRAGEISEAAAHAIADETAHLDGEHKRAVEDRLFPDAGTHTPPRLRREARRAMAEIDPALLKQRHAAERKRRDVQLSPGKFGMARLSAYLTADAATAIYAVIRGHAKTLRTDGRSFEERKADALAELILNPKKRPKPRITTQIRVVVPAGTALGLTDDAAHLAGYGPIPADMARDLAANGTWRRLLTDPVSGEALDYGTTRYRPTAPLTERVVARAGDCDAPGCLMPAHDCDLDHVVPHRPDGTGGPTSEDNLRPRCQHHHDVKGLPGWTVANNPDGTSTWRTPHGKTYISRPSGFIPRRR
jgi:hypothetical protein